MRVLLDEDVFAEAIALVCRLTEEDRCEVKSVLRVHCGATIFLGPLRSTACQQFES